MTADFHFSLFPPPETTPGRLFGGTDPGPPYTGPGAGRLTVLEHPVVGLVRRVRTTRRPRQKTCLTVCGSACPVHARTGDSVAVVSGRARRLGYTMAD